VDGLLVSDVATVVFRTRHDSKEIDGIISRFSVLYTKTGEPPLTINISSLRTVIPLTCSVCLTQTAVELSRNAVAI